MAQVFSGQSRVQQGVKAWMNAHGPHDITEQTFASMQKLIYRCGRCQSWLDIDKRMGTATVMGVQLSGDGCLICKGIDLEGGRCEACGRGKGDFLIDADWRCPKCEVQRAPSIRMDASNQTYITCYNCDFERRVIKTTSGYAVMDTGGDLRASTNRIPQGPSSWACTRCASSDYILSQAGDEVIRVCKGCGIREFLATGGYVPPDPPSAFGGFVLPGASTPTPAAWTCPWCGSMDPPSIIAGAGTVCSFCDVSEDRAREAAAALKGLGLPPRARAVTKPLPAPERPDSRKRFIRD